MDHQQIERYWSDTEALRRVSEHLRLDQQTLLPDAATDARAQQIGLLDGMIRERTASAELQLMLDRCDAGGSGSLPVMALSRRDLDAERRRPRELLSRWAAASASAFPAWRDARARSDWSRFAPHLDRLVDLNLEIAEAIGYTDHPLDALLSLYADGPTKQQVSTIFAELGPHVHHLSSTRTTRPGMSRVHPALDRASITRFAHAVGDLLGFDWSRGALAFSPHPFTSPAGPSDVRVTVRDDVPFSDLTQAIVHELGHAVYEQGIWPELWDTPAGRGIMPYVHESQAKFFENIVGRREDFCSVLTDLATEAFGGLPDGVTEQTLFEEQVYAPASLIRTGTDEVSFNQHIILRWDIEVALLDRQIRAADVPAIWNERAAHMFGRAPRDDAEGCLQDPHWCARYFGLFSSYVIGNVLSAQLAEAAAASGVSVQEAVAERDMTPVLTWLRANVHGPGRLYPLQELALRATGREIHVDAYLRHLSARYGDG